jgi:hypothetical protein
VTLEADSRDSQLNLTYPVSGAGLSDTDAASGLAAIDGLLAQAANDPTQLVLLQSIGSVQRTTTGRPRRLPGRSRDRHVGPRWQRVLLQRAERPGLRRDLHVRRPADAPSFLSPWAKTASALATGTPGHLIGVLARNTLSQYYPQLAGSKASLDFSLPFVAYQDTVPWPDRDTPGHLAALSCIAQALGLPEPIESNYLNESFSFSSAQTSLSRLTFLNVETSANPACENPTYTQQDFDDVQGQLNQELQDGAGVSKLITNLQLPLGTSADAANANVLDIAQAIQSSLGNPSSSASAQQSLPVPPTDGRDYQCPSMSLQFPDQTIPQVFTPFAGGTDHGPDRRHRGRPGDRPVDPRDTDQTFLSNDPDKRASATGPIPASIYNAMFTDPTNEKVESPASCGSTSTQTTGRPR